MKTRQAVILIHGIGEQRPMDTLRAFVKSLFKDGEYYNKPDRMSQLFELRSLILPGKGGKPVTDFYEYYWAHNMRDTRMCMIYVWLKSIFWRSPFKIPDNFRCIYWFALGITLLTLAAVFRGYFENSYISAIIPAGLWGVILIVFRYFILKYIGDAARYLTPDPDNIAQRNIIRKEGIELLRSLHDSGKYSRIIVVGHSLGSVIGYDILRNFWGTLTLPEVLNGNRIKQEVRKSFDATVNEAFNIYESHKAQYSFWSGLWETCTFWRTVQPPVKRDPSVAKIQDLQYSLFSELREIGYPWLVTDFITLGAPLTYGALLMADDESDFKQKKVEGEYPTCPPFCEAENKVIFYKRKCLTSSGSLTDAYIPVRDTVFSCVRWTNIYFPEHFILLGDVIGGPLRKTFGFGIRDVPVKLSVWRMIFAHCRYWKKYRAKTGENETEPLVMLKKALKL